MRVDVVGYNKVEYTKNGEDRFFYKFFVVEPEESGKITSGLRCAEVIASEKYAEEKLFPAVSAGSALHVGWEKDGSRRPFLYVK